MRQLTVLALALALGALAAVVLASCGGGEDAKLLPGNTAAEISENLDRVRQFVSEDECIGAENATQEISAQVEGLGGVDEKLKQALQRGAEKLDEVVATCEETETETVSPASEAPSTEEEKEAPPGLEKKAEKEREKEEKTLEKEAQKQEKQEEKEEKEVPPVTPTPPAETPPSEGGGTGASGGVGPGAPVGEGE